MDDKTRTVFLLSVVAGLGYGEIGLRLGISPAEVERRVADALVHLDRAVRPSER